MKDQGDENRRTSQELKEVFEVLRRRKKLSRDDWLRAVWTFFLLERKQLHVKEIVETLQKPEYLNRTVHNRQVTGALGSRNLEKLKDRKGWRSSLSDPIFMKSPGGHFSGWELIQASEVVKRDLVDGGGPVQIPEPDVELPDAILAVFGESALSDFRADMIRDLERGKFPKEVRRDQRQILLRESGRPPTPFLLQHLHLGMRTNQLPDAAIEFLVEAVDGPSRDEWRRSLRDMQDVSIDLLERIAVRSVFQKIGSLGKFKLRWRRVRMLAKVVGRCADAAGLSRLFTLFLKDDLHIRNAAWVAITFCPLRKEIDEQWQKAVHAREVDNPHRRLIAEAQHLQGGSWVITFEMLLLWLMGLFEIVAGKRFPGKDQIRDHVKRYFDMLVLLELRLCHLLGGNR